MEAQFLFLPSSSCLIILKFCPVRNQCWRPPPAPHGPVFISAPQTLSSATSLVFPVLLNSAWQWGKGSCLHLLFTWLPGAASGWPQWDVGRDLSVLGTRIVCNETSLSYCQMLGTMQWGRPSWDCLPPGCCMKQDAGLGGSPVLWFVWQDSSVSIFPLCLLLHATFILFLPVLLLSCSCPEWCGGKAVLRHLWGGGLVRESS